MDETWHPVPSVPAPTAGVDPRVALATAMHVGPGVYAVLVGSGMSSAAGIPTGWHITQDLVRKVAVAEGASADEIGDDLLTWWEKQGRPEARYDTLLEALAPTKHARQLLLRGYFEPDPPVAPTPGHKALAGLCADGRVRLIVTTNFDRLIERALDQVGLSPQVIASPAAVTGMTPLQQAPLTVLKLHGDYATPGLRNTPEELGTYPSKWRKLLARVFDEFGLLVVGWSAEYDVALCEAMRSAPSRRYPTFWASFNGNLAEPARRLIAQRRTTVIDTTGADEFLGDLTERIERLDQTAARRGRPTLLRMCAFMPNEQTTPQGWAALPLIQLRVATSVGPAALDECGIIRVRDRNALLLALRTAALTVRLRNLAGFPSASALADPLATAVGELPVDWVATPGAQQTTEYASYRFGGDASCGVSALASARLPSYSTGGQAVFTTDVALSLANRLRLGEIAAVFRDGLLLTTAMLPGALSEILPSDAQVTQAELHVLAAATDGHNSKRPNELTQRVDLTSLGEPTRNIGPLLTFAARLSSPMAEREAAELVAEGIEFMVLANGYLDPGFGLIAMRQELGLTSQPT